MLVALFGLVVVQGLTGKESKPGLAVAPAQAQATSTAAAVDTAWNGQGGISVAGTGTVLIKPDVVRVMLGVQGKAATVVEAQKQTADKSAALTDALKQAGVKDEDIKTADYSINPDYIYQNGQPPRLTGYNVNNRLEVTLRDISKAGNILDAAGAVGTTEIGGITFTLSDTSEALKQARSAAMADARLKADQLAASGKVSVGNVLRITENTESQPPTPRTFNSVAPGAAAAPVSTVIEAGQLKVTVNVSVTYSIK